MTEAQASNVVPFQATRDRFMLANDRRSTWSYVVPAGTPIEALAAPERWMHVSSRVRPWDKLEIIEEAGEYYAEFLVISADQYGLVLKPLRGVELNGQVGTHGASARIPREFSVVYRGPVLKWTVLHDSKPLHSGCETESVAYQWLHSHVAAGRK